MSHTVYASFVRSEEAEKAAGALVSLGVRPEDLSVVREPENGLTSTTAPTTVATNVVDTPGSVYGVAEPAASVIENEAPIHDDSELPHDVKASAIQGSLIGAGLGAVAAVAALIIPGVGFVLGAGALASAIAGMVATAGAGAAAGAIVAYLKDMGVEDDVAAEYGDTVSAGGAVLAVNLPSGGVDEDAANRILKEHSARTINRYASRGYVA